MTKIKNPLFSLGSVGRLTSSLTFLRRRRQDIVESTPVVPDARTMAQLSWRHMYQKATALWRALSPDEKWEWESQARRRHMTGYAWFVSQALKPNPGLYLPLQGGVMQGEIDMATHRILDIPDPSLDQEPVTRKYYHDNLPAGPYTQGARVYHSVHVSIPHNTWTAAPFNSEDYDTDGIHDPVTNNSRLTCKTAGLYYIVGMTEFWENATGFRSSEITYNGIRIADMMVPNIGAVWTTSFLLLTIYSLNVDDYVELRVYQNSGGALLLLGVSNYNTHFWMQRVG